MLDRADPPTGILALVLHAHLPFVRHPEHERHLEEQWLYEAVAATYLPLLEIFRGLVADGVRFRITMSLSPPLVTMLRDDLLKLRTAAYLDRLLELADKERRRLAGDPTFRALADFYAERFGRLKTLYDHLQGDLIGAFAELQDHGSLELITVGATHGFLPTIREPNARRAQIQVAVQHYQQTFGCAPRGIWLPECGISDGIDQVLADFGLRFFFADTHGVAHASPPPPHGAAMPIYTPAGVAVFGRDHESSQQVWSSDEGYPGDPIYREFYRDVGFDAPLGHVAPYIGPDGIRTNTGFKYHRITGKIDLAHKQPYDPRAANERAALHAGHFLFCREHQMRHLGRRMDRPPVVVAPYDAELYGHWWFEGPTFLDVLLRKLHFDQNQVVTATPSEILARYPVLPVATPPLSSWGAGGYAEVWVAGENDWIYRHQHRAEARMVELAARYADDASPLVRRALDQAARELLLLQSSDWAFILRNKTQVGYAIARVKAHLGRFDRLCTDVVEGRIDEAWLADLEARDNIFPALDFRVYR
jgi:1,4-alpha-glucan branching enzyme